MTPEDRAAVIPTVRAFLAWLEAPEQPQETEAERIARAIVTLHEGKRNKLYQDTVGRWTGGVGHNFSDRGLSDAAVDFILSEDMAIAEQDAIAWLGADAWSLLNDVRKAALIDFSLNLGAPTLAQFVNTKRLLHAGDYDGAATNMLASRWAAQVGNQPGQRAWRITEMIRTGAVPDAVPGLA